MITFKGKSGLLLAASFVLACLLALWGLVSLWEDSNRGSTLYLTRVIGELEKSQDTMERVWVRDFAQSLRVLADNSTFSTFTSRVSGMGLGRDVLFSLTGRSEEQKSMLALLAQRRSAEEMERLRSFAADADAMRTQLRELADRYNFMAAYLFSVEGMPCLGTTTFPARFLDISKTIVPGMQGSANPALSLPAYVSEDKLCVDIAVPMVLTDKRNVLTYNVGILVVTIDLGDAMDRVQAALSEKSSVRTAVLELQPDESLVALSRTGTQKVTLKELAATESGIAFGLYRIPGLGSSVYSVGKRFLTTQLFLVSALPEQAAELAAPNAQRTGLVATCLKAVVLLLALFLFWLFVFRQREREITEKTRREAARTLQQGQVLQAVDSGMNLAMVCTDFDRNILLANTSFAHLAGREETGSLAHLTTNDLPQDLSADIAQRTALIWETPRAMEGETRLCEKGVWRSFQVLATPYIDEDGFLAGVILVYRDMSNRLALRERCELMVEQNAAALHKIAGILDPHAGKIATLVADIAQIVAELDNDKSKKTAQILSLAGRLFLFGNATRKSNQILLGTGDTSRRVAISLAGLDFAGLPVQETVSDMYERLDGSGFPRHLKGEEISKPARYLGIAEEVCTIMHPREGAFPEDWEKALAPILDTKRFDPAASRLFHYLKSPQGQKILLRLRRK